MTEPQTPRPDQDLAAALEALLLVVDAPTEDEALALLPDWWRGGPCVDVPPSRDATSGDSPGVSGVSVASPAGATPAGAAFASARAARTRRGVGPRRRRHVPRAAPAGDVDAARERLRP